MWSCKLCSVTSILRGQSTFEKLWKSKALGMTLISEIKLIGGQNLFRQRMFKHFFTALSRSYNIGLLSD